MSLYFKSTAILLTFFKWGLFIVLIINASVMNAQDHPGTRNVLNVRQQSIVTISALTATVVEPDMLVRISEIEILPEYLEEYNAILKEEAAASVKLEPGVFAIFPMYVQNSPTQIRIIEIYANRASYESHLKTPHFQYYKTNTLKMVKSLKLVDMNILDKETMLDIFKKMN